MAHTVSGSPWLIAPFWQRQGELSLGSVPVTPSSSCFPLSRVRVSSYDPHDDTHNAISNAPERTWIPDPWDCCGLMVAGAPAPYPVLASP